MHPVHSRLSESSRVLMNVTQEDYSFSMEREGKEASRTPAASMPRASQRSLEYADSESRGTHSTRNGRSYTAGFVSSRESNANLTFRSRTELLEYIQRVKAKLSVESAKHLSVMVFNCEKFNVRDDELLAHVSLEVQKRIINFEPNPRASIRRGVFVPAGLCQITRAFEFFKVKDPDLFLTITVDAMRQIEDFKLKELIRITATFAQLQFEAPSLFKAIKARDLRDFIPIDLAQTAGIYAKLEKQDVPFFKAIAAESIRKIGDFPAHDLANLVWAFSRVRIDDHELLQAVQKASLKEPARGVRKIDDFSLQDLSNLLGSCSRLHYFNASNQMFFEELIKVVRKKIGDRSITSSLLSSITWALVNIFNSYEVSKLGSPSKEELMLVHGLLIQIDSLGLNDHYLMQVRQLAQIFSYLEFFHKEYFQPRAYARLHGMVEGAFHDKETLDQLRPDSSSAHSFIHKGLEWMLGRGLEKERFIRCFFVDTILGEKQGFEVVGRSHFLFSGALIGDELMRKRILRALGWEITEILISEYDKFRNSWDQLFAYLVRELPANIVAQIRNKPTSTEMDWSADRAPLRKPEGKEEKKAPPRAS